MTSILAAVKARLPANIGDMGVTDVLTSVENTLVDKSESQNNELRDAERIKLSRGRTVQDYISKQRILRRDMIQAGCAEISDEKVTIRYIIKGTQDNSAWDTFRQTWTALPDAVRPDTITKLERPML